MITVEEPGLLTTVCNGCGAKEGLIQFEITRNYKGTMFHGQTGYAIGLCPACRRELKEALERTEGAKRES